MPRIFLLLLAFLFFGVNCSSQTIPVADSNAISRAAEVAEKMQSYLNGSDYLLYSVGDKRYLLLSKDGEGSFELFYLNYNNDIDLKLIRKLKTSRLLKRAFDEKNYKTGYINFNSVFFSNGYKEASGNMTYFYLFKKGKKYGESRLSVNVSPNPIDEKIYSFLNVRLLECMAVFAPHDL